MIDDPASKACAEALAVDRALSALARQRDLTEDDHLPVDAALDGVAASAITSCAGIAAVAALVLEVEEPDPHVARMLVAIRDAASRLAQAERPAPVRRGDHPPAGKSLRKQIARTLGRFALQERDAPA